MKCSQFKDTNIPFSFINKLFQACCQQFRRYFYHVSEKRNNEYFITIITVSSFKNLKTSSNHWKSKLNAIIDSRHEIWETRKISSRVFFENWPREFSRDGRSGRTAWTGREGRGRIFNFVRRPSGNFETNWLSRESSAQTDERWFRRSARWIQKHPARGSKRGRKRGWKRVAANFWQLHHARPSAPNSLPIYNDSKYSYRYSASALPSSFDRRNDDYVKR